MSANPGTAYLLPPLAGSTSAPAAGPGHRPHQPLTSSRPESGAESTCRVFLVDDHAIFCTSMETAIRGLAGYTVVGTARDGRTALTQIRSLRPDLALVDFHMPGGCGWELMAEIRRSELPVRVIMLTLYATNPIALETLRQGARGFVDKGRVGDDLVEALKLVSAGGIFLSPPLGGAGFQLVGSRSNEGAFTRQHLASLTSKKRSNEEISLALGLEPDFLPFTFPNLGLIYNRVEKP